MEATVIWMAGSFTSILCANLWEGTTTEQRKRLFCGAYPSARPPEEEGSEGQKPERESGSPTSA